MLMYQKLSRSCQQLSCQGLFRGFTSPDGEKECKRIAIRYEKKTCHYRAMLKWAFTAEYLSR
jgi:hypothetical protein